MIYLAQPYTDPDPHVREKRFNDAVTVLADYTKLGFFIYSPIVHYHHVALRHNMPVDFSFWRELNFLALARCAEIWILPLAGHDKSLGLKAEIREAVRLNIPATYLEEDARRLRGK
jgi:hypothetical protein